MRIAFNRRFTCQSPVTVQTFHLHTQGKLILFSVLLFLFLPGWMDQKQGTKKTKQAIIISCSTAPDTSIASPPFTDTLIQFESAWKYWDNGTDPGTDWTSNRFNDSGWKTGTGKFGYGTTGNNTTIGFGDSANNKYVTAYFRKTFGVTDSSMRGLNHFSGQIKRDDGAIVYINGKEVLRSNMPLSAVSAYTFAPGSATGDNGTIEIAFTIPDSVIIAGENIIAVEIHQYSPTSPDAAFDLMLMGKNNGDKQGLPAVLYYEGFEETPGFARLKKQVATDYGFAIDSVINFKGTKSGRWELQQSDTVKAKGNRTETLFSARFAQEETWYSFAAYFPSDGYQKDRHSEIINQWHQGIKGLPMLTLRTANDHFVVKKRGVDSLPNVKYDLGLIAKDKWTTFVIHLKQHPANGLLQVWIDDTLKLDLQGSATMFPGPFGRWKMGLYKSLWENKDTVVTAKRVWFVDEIKIGNEGSSYAFMKPEGNYGLPVQQQTSAKPAYAQRQDALNTNALSLYPTLVKRGALLHIENKSSKGYRAIITDLSGRIHATLNIHGTQYFETAHLQPGTYLLVMEGQRKGAQKKFIVLP